jgi:hypothetical protein
MSFVDFVKNCKQGLDGQGKELYLVLGNEASDFDSIGSALTYAYYKNSVQQVSQT